MKNSSRKNDKTYQLISLTGYVLFLYGIGVLLTLYVQDAYFDIMEAKASCFRFFMYILLPLFLLLIILKIKDHRFRIRNNLLLQSLIFLALISLISTLASYYPEYAFTGEIGWHVGSFCIGSLVLAVLAFEGEYIKEKKMYLPLLCIVLFEFVLIILGGTRMNLFSFRTLIQGEDYYSFYGTLGNCNWIVGYLSLFVPLFVCLYLKEENRLMKVFYYICCITGLTASILNGADGMYLAYLFGFFFLIPYLFQSLVNLRKTALLATGFSIFLLIIKYCGLFDERLRRMNGIGPYVFDASLILLFLGVTVFLLLGKFSENDYAGNRKKIVLAAETSVLCLSAIFAFLLFIRFGTELGNGRIELWQFSIEKYLHVYNWKEKLLGIGPELLIDVYSEIEAGERVFASSHSEAVQMLMSMGILGLLSWIMCWVSVFSSFFKTKAFNNGNAMVIFASLFAYFGQSLVNSATTLNVCVLAVFVILLSQSAEPERFSVTSSMKKKKRQEKKAMNFSVGQKCDR